jgi:CheY-like chemotaxis protein
VNDAVLSTSSQCKVLIVDDEPHAVLVLSMIVRRLGVNVIGAYNGEQALKATREHKPALVLTDLMMPKLSGAEFCRLVKSGGDTAHIPVIIISAVPVEERPKCGADGHLMKPYKPSDVEELVYKYWDR